mgnify:CR=1 FL=1
MERNVYEHCKEAYKEICCHSIDPDICTAALWHDIGKPYVKAFVDSKGETCEYAHYYQHQCVGAYMFYGFNDITPYTAWLISTHMEPFFNSKYYNNLPAFLRKDQGERGLRIYLHLPVFFRL